MTQTTFLAEYEKTLDEKKLTKGQKRHCLLQLIFFQSRVMMQRQRLRKTKKSLLEILMPMMENIVPVIQEEFKAEIVKNLDEDSDDLGNFVHFVVHDRFHFIKENSMILRIFVQEAMTKPDIRELIVKRMTEVLQDSQRELGMVLDIANKIHPEYDQVVLLRSFIGPLGAYFVQRFILAPNLPYDEERDLALVEKQVLSVWK